MSTKEQIYTCLDEDNSEYFCFDIRKIKKMIKAQPRNYRTRRYLIRPEDVAFVGQNHGVEQDHLERISLADLNTKGIVIDFPDGTSSIVDGNHRMTKRFQLGHQFMDFYVLTLQEARKALLDIPASMVNFLVGREK